MPSPAVPARIEPLDPGITAMLVDPLDVGGPWLAQVAPALVVL